MVCIIFTYRVLKSTSMYHLAIDKVLIIQEIQINHLHNLTSIGWLNN